LGERGRSSLSQQAGTMTMPCITRYVLAELLKVFLTTLTAMTLFLVVGVIAHEAIREGLGPSAILRLVPYSIPMALRFTIPGTILFATCSVFGRMSAANEIVAIKSLGISPLRVVWPALSLAMFVSILALWLNDVAVSWGALGIDRVVVQSIEQIAYGKLRTQRAYSNQRGFSIHVRDVEGRRLIMPTFSWQPMDGSSQMVVTAEEAELQFNPQTNALGIKLTNMEMVGDNVHGVWPDTITYEIPLSIASRKGDLSRTPSEIALGDLPREIRRQQESIETTQQALAADAAAQLVLGQFRELSGKPWRERLGNLQGQRIRLHRLQTEPWRRWATGFSCFFFVLVGAPLAIKLRNADVWTSFFFCFFPILVIYYPLLMYGMQRAKIGALPPYSVWSGNLVLALIGCWLLHLVRRR
jgi:lipopolysaccharide export system permease protein